MIQDNNLKTSFAALSIFVTLGILFCTLWPFNPFPQNKVSWLKESDGIRLDWGGVVLSPRLKVQETSSILNGAASLEIWLKPAETLSVYTVLDIGEPGNPSRFRLRQYHDGLIVSRDRRVVDGRLKRVKIDLDHGLQRGRLTLVTITSGHKGASLFIDGKLRQVYPNFKFTSDDLSGQIVLGTAPVDFEPWSGEIRGLAIYSKELTPGEVLANFRNWTVANPSGTSDLTDCMARYQFNERNGREIHNQVKGGKELEIPTRFRVPSKAFLQLPWDEFDWSRSYLNDVLRNIVGFVPFGFVVCAYLALTGQRRSAALLAILAGSTLSVCIEVLQAYIPQRTSGTTDILTNTLGTVLGVILARSAAVQGFLEKTGFLPSTGDSKV